jgi:5-methylcytosine-specific restriction endonuclease McrA
MRAAPVSFACRICGDHETYITSGRLRTRCESCRASGRTLGRPLVVRPPKPTASCLRCHGSFVRSSDRRTFCSKQCVLEHRRRHLQGQTSAVPLKSCDECEQSFVARRGAIFCSDDCRAARKRAKSHATYIPTPTRIYQCEQCSVEFTRLGRQGAPRFCSKQCYRRSPGYLAERHASNSMRRARRKTNGLIERIDRREVFERDGWVCRICRQPVSQNEDFRHPLAPTIDHVVPLAVGGEHTIGNLQTAHRQCNELKGSGDDLRVKIQVRARQRLAEAAA